jgi:hypothetical protein
VHKAANARHLRGDAAGRRTLSGVAGRPAGQQGHRQAQRTRTVFNAPGRPAMAIPIKGRHQTDAQVPNFTQSHSREFSNRL